MGEKKMNIYIKRNDFPIILLTLMVLSKNVSAGNDHLMKDFPQQHAKQAAETEYKKIVDKRVKTFHCRLVEQNDDSWFFLCKNLDKNAPIDTDGFVTVNKKSGAAVVSIGG